MDLYEPRSGSKVHDFTGPDSPVWTVRLPPESVVIERNGRRLTVDVQDLAVIDRLADRAPGTVSFRIAWQARGRRRRLGRPTAPAGDPAAFQGRLFTAARATGTFSGASGGFTFQSKAGRLARSLFAELGTEQNGTLLAPAASRCVACAVGGDAWPTPW